jgi:hypothetical protein
MFPAASFFVNQVPIQSDYFKQKALGQSVLAHHFDCGNPACLGELELAIVTHSQEPIALHARNGLRDGGAGVIEAFGNSSTHRHNAVLLKLQNGLEVHLRGVD